MPVNGEHGLIWHDVFARRFSQVHVELAGDLLGTEIRGVHAALAPEAVIERGEALLTVKEQQTWIYPSVRRTSQYTGTEAHGLVTSVQREEGTKRITAQHGHDERADAVFIPGVCALEIRKLDIPAVDASEEVREVIAWRRKTHGSEPTSRCGNVPV